MNQQPKIAIVGAGNVGTAAAAAVAARNLGETYLYDIVEGLAEGLAMDINQSSPLGKSNGRVVGCDCFAELADADIVVISAGSPRKAGMRRSDLLKKNWGPVSSVAEEIMQYCPRAVVLLVTNPTETLVWFVKERWPELRILGLGCTLDTVRFRHFLARAAGVSASSVSAMVIGTHDDNMIPLIGRATIGSAPADALLADDQLDSVVAQTRQAGAAIVAKLKTRGSYYTASHCIAQVVEAVVRDTREVFPLTIACSGQYGHHDTSLALPICVGRRGVNSLVEIDLHDSERVALDRCAAGVRRTVESTPALL